MHPRVLVALLVGGVVLGSVLLDPRPGNAQEPSAEGEPTDVRQGLKLHDIPVHDPYVVPHEPTQT